MGENFSPEEISTRSKRWTDGPLRGKNCHQQALPFQKNKIHGGHPLLSDQVAENGRGKAEPSSRHFHQLHITA